jgi:uncharacterized membrane protein
MINEVFKLVAMSVPENGLSTSWMAKEVEGSGIAITDLSPTTVANNIIKWLSWGIGVISIIFIIIGGIRYAISGGDEKKVESAKKTLLYAVIGLAVAILAYAVAALVYGLASSEGASTSGNS